MFKLEDIPQLHQWSGAVRVWALGFVVLASLGLGVSLLMVAYDSGLAPSEVATRFSGPESDEVYPHTVGSLLQTTHTHIYTLAFFEFLLGGLFLFSSASARVKIIVIGGAWAAMLLDHAGMWVAFQWGRQWIWLVMLGGTLMSLALFTQLSWCFKNLIQRRNNEK